MSKPCTCSVLHFLFTTPIPLRGLELHNLRASLFQSRVSIFVEDNLENRLVRNCSKFIRAYEFISCFLPFDDSLSRNENFRSRRRVVNPLRSSLAARVKARKISLLIFFPLPSAPSSISPSFLRGILTTRIHRASRVFPPRRSFFSSDDCRRFFSLVRPRENKPR